MDKCNKKSKNSFKNLSGETFSLNISKTGGCVSIIIKHDSDIFKSALALLIIVVCNFLCLLFSFLRIEIITATFIASLLYLYKILSTLKQEHLVIAYGLGYQISTKYILGRKTVFIPYEQVQKVFLNEIIYKQQVIFILTIMINEPRKTLITLFEDSQLRLQALEIIYKSICE